MKTQFIKVCLMVALAFGMAVATGCRKNPEDIPTPPEELEAGDPGAEFEAQVQAEEAEMENRTE